MTINVYPYLILVGVSFLVAAAWLLNRARTQTRLGQQLVRLNETLHYDVPDFLRRCWPILQAGGFSGLRWQLQWFGVTLEGAAGKVDEQEGCLSESFDVEEVTLQVELFHGKHDWEQKYFNRVMADHLFLLLRMDLWIKHGTVRSTFEQTAKLTVFLQHDMKNMLQLVSLAADQLENRRPEQNERLLQSLALSVPAIRDRAGHMLHALLNDSVGGSKRNIALAPTFYQVAALYELKVTVTGEATASVPEEALHSIVDNLLGNYSWQLRHRKSQDMDLHIRLEIEEGQVRVAIGDRHGTPCQWPERLFEPFWSEHGAGRGIGLYQSRQLAIAAGGSLTVSTSTQEPLVFTLTLPLGL